MSYVPDDPDNFPRDRLAIDSDFDAGVDNDSLADRIDVREEASGQGFIDQSDSRRILLILMRECAAFQERNPHGAKIVRANRSIIGDAYLTGSSRPCLDIE